MGGRHTDSANDGGATEILRGHHFGTELGVPLQLSLVREMVHG